MYYSMNLLMKFLSLILIGYPSEEFVLVTLHTLTRLAAHALVDVPDQVELLLTHLEEDPRYHSFIYYVSTYIAQNLI